MDIDDEVKEISLTGLNDTVNKLVKIVESNQIEIDVLKTGDRLFRCELDIVQKAVVELIRKFS